jgi:HlyD family secretion protein
MMTNRRRAQSTARWVIGAALFAAAVAAGAVLALRYARPAVTVTEAVDGPVVQAFYSTGTVEPEREFPIKSNVAGVLTAVRVDKGSRVKAGDVLAVVAEPELRFAAQRAQAELDERAKRADPKTSPVLQEYDAKIATATALLDIANREQARVTELIARNAASQTDLDRALDRVKALAGDIDMHRAQQAAKKLEMEKDLAVARAALATANWNLEQQTTKAPIDGVVLDRPVSLGTRVAVNDELMRIADVAPANLVMRAAVDEEDITGVRPEQVVRMTLYAFPNTTFVGRVTRVYDKADVDRRTFEVDVRLSEPNDRLLPGMTGELAFIISAKDKALVVPSQALQGDAVWVVRDGRLVRTQPQIGIRSVERVEIVSGLQPGDRVVISPVGSMSEGQTVRMTYMDPITAAGLNKVPLAEKPFGAFD